jgi:hypothetical protein
MEIQQNQRPALGTLIVSGQKYRLSGALYEDVTRGGLF